MIEWRLVPVEPTTEMLTAGSKSAMESGYSPLGVWAEMLVAAQPKPAPVLLTDEEIDEWARTLVKGNKSVNWLARAIEAAVLKKNGL